MIDKVSINLVEVVHFPNTDYSLHTGQQTVFVPGIP